MVDTGTNRHRGLLAALLVFALMLSACASSGEDTADTASGFAASSDDSGGDDSGSFDMVDEAMEDDDAMEDEAEFAAASTTTVARRATADDSGTGDAGSDAPSSQQTDGGGDLGDGGPVPTSLSAAEIGRQIIFTARITVGVDDVATAGEEAAAIIESVGGFVSGQNTVGGNDARSEITFKVLPEDFGEALERLGRIGELRGQTITSDDVTERVVNLESRIEVAQLGVDRLRDALVNAPSLEDYAELERLLLQRESDLEVMRGELRTLQDRVNLATITLVLTQDVVSNSVALDITRYETHDQGLGCPGEKGLSHETGTAVTICYEITNTGEQTLVDVSLTDTVLEITDDNDLIEVFGELERIEPGQSIIVAHEFVAERNLRPRPRVSALPVDPEGVVSGPAVSALVNFEISTFEPPVPEEDPGFGDGFDAATSVLAALWTAITVIVGFTLPMLVVILPIALAVWVGVRWIRPRRELRLAERQARVDAYRRRYQPPAPGAPTSASTDRRTAAAAASGTATAVAEREDATEDDSAGADDL